METLAIDGRPVRVWKNGPKSLQELFYASAAFGGRTFLVHEAERITYDAFARAALAFARALAAAASSAATGGDRHAQPAGMDRRLLRDALAGAIATP